MQFQYHPRLYEIWASINMTPESLVLEIEWYFGHITGLVQWDKNKLDEEGVEKIGSRNALYVEKL